MIPTVEQLSHWGFDSFPCVLKISRLSYIVPTRKRAAGFQGTTLEAPGLVAVALPHQVTDLVQTRHCRSLPLISTSDVAQPFQCTGHSSSAPRSTSLSSSTGPDSGSSTGRRRRMREWRGDENGSLVASGMESAGDVARTGSAGPRANCVAPISAPTAPVHGAAGELFGVGLTAAILP